MPRASNANKATHLLLAGGLGVPLAAAALVLLPGLGGLDLWSPDEPRYAQVAEEMRSFRHGFRGFILLHLLGEPYGQKPPLYYWLAVLLGAPFGHVGHLAARLPSALSGIAVVVLTAVFGRKLFARPELGNIAALILLGVLRFAHQARRAQLDVLLTCCELSALLAFWWIDRPQKQSERPQTGPLLWLHGSIALGLLVKGPVAALPYAIIILFLVWERRSRDLRRIFPYWSPALAAGPALIWLAASLNMAPDGFLDQTVTENLWTRFVSGKDHARPVYYFLYQFPVDFLPWTPVALVATVSTVLSLRRSSSKVTADARAERFLLAWAGTFLIFFSISAEKRGLYLLPAFPAFALLSARWLGRYMGRQGPPTWLVIGAMLVFGSVGATSLLALAGIGAEVLPVDSVEIPGSLYALFASLGIGAFAALARGRWLRADGSLQLSALILTPILLEGLFLMALLPVLNHEKSPRPVAMTAARAAQADSAIAVYRHSGLAGGIAYYSNRRTMALEQPEDLQNFVASGGRIIVARAETENEVRSLAAGRIIAHMRGGRRSLIIFEIREFPAADSSARQKK